MVMVQFQLYFGSCVPSVFVTVEDDLAVLAITYEKPLSMFHRPCKSPLDLIHIWKFWRHLYGPYQGYSDLYDFFSNQIFSTISTPKPEAADKYI